MEEYSSFPRLPLAKEHLRRCCLLVDYFLRTECGSTKIKGKLFVPSDLLKVVAQYCEELLRWAHFDKRYIRLSEDCSEMSSIATDDDIHHSYVMSDTALSAGLRHTWKVECVAIAKDKGPDSSVGVCTGISSDYWLQNSTSFWGPGSRCWKAGDVASFTLDLTHEDSGLWKLEIVCGDCPSKSSGVAVTGERVYYPCASVWTKTETSAWKLMPKTYSCTK